MHNNSTLLFLRIFFIEVFCDRRLLVIARFLITPANQGSKTNDYCNHTGYRADDFRYRS